MIKKTVVAAFAALALSGFVYAQEGNGQEDNGQEGNGQEWNGAELAAGPRAGPQMEVSAEVKTGVFWDSRAEPSARMHHNDYAGNALGRFRLDMGFSYQSLGIRVRFEQEGLAGTVNWYFAYAYGNFLDEQFRISLGRLGPSPWDWGGTAPRWIWAPHDNRVALDDHRRWLDDVFGIRMEITPAAVPGLNVGLTVNQWDNLRNPRVEDGDIGISELLMESVIGVAYANDHFHGRLSLRLDGVADAVFCDYYEGWLLEGMSLMYRLEPRFITNLVPDLRVWLNGWWRGIGAETVETAVIGANTNTMMDWRNWLYVEYAPADFTAELRLGLQLTGFESHVFTVRPSFFYNVLPFLRAGAAFRYEYNFGTYAGTFWGGRTPPHTAFNPARHFFSIEPQVRIQFGATYFAFVYGFEGRVDDGNLTQRHWINLRTTISF